MGLRWLAVVGEDRLGAGVDTGWSPHVQYRKGLDGLECGRMGPALGGFQAGIG